MQALKFVGSFPANAEGNRGLVLALCLICFEFVPSSLKQKRLKKYTVSQLSEQAAVKKLT